MLRAFLPVNYRNLRVSDKALPQFERINLLVGPNNSGKSNFIRAMSFPRDMLLSEGVPTKFLNAVEKHGRADVINRALRPSRSHSPLSSPHVAIYWIFDSFLPHSAKNDIFAVSPNSTITHATAFVVGESGSFPSGFYIGNEIIIKSEQSKKFSSIQNIIDNSVFETSSNGAGKYIFRSRSHNHQRQLSHWQDLATLEIAKNETVLGQISALLKNKEFYEKAYPEFSLIADQIQEFSQRFHTYTSTDLDVRKLADGAKIDLSVRVMDKEGSQFINVLRYLDQQHDFLDQYAEHLRELLPDLKRIKIVDASDTYKQVELHIGGQKYKLHEMSDGTLKALWLALLLFSPEPGSVLSIDEPELNLHPAWLKVIGRWAQRFTSAEQLFLSTHSPDLLDTFTEGFKSGQVALFVFGLGDKEVRRVQPIELESFFKDGWELGDLYRVGEPALGGWPW